MRDTVVFFQQISYIIMTKYEHKGVYAYSKHLCVLHINNMWKHVVNVNKMTLIWHDKLPLIDEESLHKQNNGYF